MKNKYTYLLLTFLMISCGTKNESFDIKRVDGNWVFSGGTCQNQSGEKGSIIYRGVNLELNFQDGIGSQTISTPYCTVHETGLNLVHVKSNIFDEAGGFASCKPNPCTINYSVILGDTMIPVKTECPSDFPIVIQNVKYEVSDQVLTRTVDIGSGVQCTYRYGKKN